MSKKEQPQREVKDLDLDELLNSLESAAGLLGIIDAAMNNQCFTDEMLGTLKKTPAYCQFNQLGDLICKAYESVEEAHTMVSEAYANA